MLVNADDLRAYKRRWEIFAEFEREEIARASAAQKLADVAMLMAAARALDPSTEEDDETQQVRRRWNLLADRLGV